MAATDGDSGGMDGGGSIGADDRDVARVMVGAVRNVDGLWLGHRGGKGGGEVKVTTDLWWW